METALRADWPLELRRLTAVRSLLDLHFGPTPELAAAAELAQGVFSVARAAVHVLDEDWLRIASQAGLQIDECSSDMAICTRVVQRRELIVIPDLSEHPELRLMPYVTAGAKLRFYAGVPLELEPGLIVGTFCLLHDKVKTLTDEDVETLHRFAEVAAALLRLQQANCILRISEENLADAAMRDPLTRFYNRLALEKVVDANLKAQEGRSELLGVLYLDMDGFKAINDTHGHRAGDVTLHTMADRIRQTVRASDVVVRMGGDEFAIFMPDLESRGQLKRVADRLLAQFQEPITLDGKVVQAGASIGGIVASRGGVDREVLLATVDGAMYEAKAAGRNRYVEKPLEAVPLAARAPSRATTWLGPLQPLERMRPRHRSRIEPARPAQHWSGPRSGG
ncbi:MAG: diguanylate cyclase domain-containing protein [Pseudorhizobium sp.]